MFRFSTSDNHAKVNVNSTNSARSRDSDITDLGHQAKMVGPDQSNVCEVYCIYSNRGSDYSKILQLLDCDSCPNFQNSDWYSWPINLNRKKYLNCCWPRKTFRRTLEERAQPVLSLPPSWLRIAYNSRPEFCMVLGLKWFTLVIHYLCYLSRRYSRGVTDIIFCEMSYVRVNVKWLIINAGRE